MTITKWKPLNEIDSITRDVLRSMDSLWDDFMPLRSGYVPAQMRELSDIKYPALDVIDRAHEIEVKCEMPGVKKDNIDISVEGKTLRVKGSLEKESVDEQENYYRKERHYSSFSRAVTLPDSADIKNIKAELENGLLSTKIQKKKEEEAVKIKVESKSGK